MRDDVRSLAVSTLRDARRLARAIAPFSDAGVPLSIDDAYSVQQALVDAELTGGEKLAGYKMGLTSAAKQQAVGVLEPIYGRLFRSMVRPAETPLDVGGLIHPRIEPELAVVLERPLSGSDVAEAEVLQSIRWVLPALEVIDSRYQDFRFTLPDVIADNASAAAVLLGSVLWRPGDVDWTTMGVVLYKNAEVVQGGATAAVLGNPIRAVARLARMLAAQGRGLPAGLLILTGAITDAVPIAAGDVILARWQDRGLMHVRCV